MRLHSQIPITWIDRSVRLLCFSAFAYFIQGEGDPNDERGTQESRLKTKTVNSLSPQITGGWFKERKRERVKEDLVWAVLSRLSVRGRSQLTAPTRGRLIGGADFAIMEFGIKRQKHRSAMLMRD
jgi:hypothetical protein